MFQLTHTYVASKVLGNRDYAVVGAILPDYTILRENGLLDDFEHISINNWLKVKDRDLAQGILTHKIVDQISHNGNKFPDFKFGYRMHAALHLKPELDAEFYVAKTYPKTIDMLYNALRNVNTSNIAAKLAPILKTKPEDLMCLLDRYIELVYLSTSATKKAAYFVNVGNKEARLELCIRKCQDAVAAWDARKVI
jgi:hypothetical protein